MPALVEEFSGIAPKADPRKMRESLAQTAKNVVLDGLALNPLPDMLATVDTVGATDISIFKYNASTWLGYTNDRDFARAPISNDALERVIITDPDTYPVVYSAGTTYRIGIPAPSAPTAAPDEVPDDPNDVSAETVSYVITYVDAWGAEGPPSDPSPSYDRVRDTDVVVTLPSVPNGNYNFGAGALTRIYRSNTGTAGSNYQYVGEVAIASNTYTDQTTNARLGEILPSITWIGPPDDDTSLYPNGPMIGVTALPNGMLAGHAHKTLCLSEPFLYHAWPLEYRITFEDVIVGIAGVASGILVTTETGAYLATGVSPAAMTVIPYDINQACVSKRGVVDMGDYAIYPSPDGLVLVTGNSAELVTEEYFTRAQWQARVPSTISAYEWERKYLAFYNDGTEKGFIFDPRGGLNAFVEIDDYLEAAYYEELTDTLFVNDAGTIRKWGQGSGSTAFQWKSKKFLQPKPQNFTVARVEAHDDLASKQITMKVWADGTLINTITFNDSKTPYARLSVPQRRAKLWEFEVSGSNPISHAGLFESFENTV